jgi:hypothetical protein
MMRKLFLSIGGEILKFVYVAEVLNSTSSRTEIAFRDDLLFRLIKLLNLPTKFDSMESAAKQMFSLDLIVMNHYSYFHDHIDMWSHVKSAFDLDYEFSTIGTKNLNNYANDYIINQHGFISFLPYFGKERKEDSFDFIMVFKGYELRVNYFSDLYFKIIAEL